MRKKLLTIGMVAPLALAGAVATAPAASASVNDDIKCDLRARLVDDDEIRLALRVDSESNQGRRFAVQIRQNGGLIVNRIRLDDDGDGTIRLRAYADDRNGVDVFRVRVVNLGTRDICTDRVLVVAGN